MQHHSFHVKIPIVLISFGGKPEARNALRMKCFEPKLYSSNLKNRTMEMECTTAAKDPIQVESNKG